MTTYYADFDLTTGNNTGVDAANAWKTFADVLAGSNGTAPAAGDTVLCKGTDTSFSSAFNISQSGTYNGGYIKFIGVNASWNNVGGSSRAVLDAGGQAIAIINETASADYIWFENFRFTNTSKASGKHGVTGSSTYTDRWVFINSIFDNCYCGYVGSVYFRYAVFFRCAFHSNSQYGVDAGGGNYFIACRAYNNSSTGCRGVSASDLFMGCVSHDNGGDGYYLWGGTAHQSVAYGNTGDAFEFPYVLNSPPILFGDRAAANGGGLKVSSNMRIFLLYYYGDNTTETSGYYDEILNNGTSTVTLNGSDTNEGFVDPSNDDYNLRSDATYRRVAVSIP